MDKLNDLKMFFYNHKKIVIISFLLLMSLSITLVFLKKDKYKSESIVYENLLSRDNELELDNEEEIYYYVDIKGEVMTPGVYSLSKGKRVVDAINSAGGVTQNADTSLLNLSLELEDGMVIIIYSKDEIKNYQKVSTEENKKEEICNGKVVNNACIVNSKTTVVNNAGEKKENEKKDNNINNSETSSKENNNKDIASEKININTASLEELMLLSKIGESKALAIINYRKENGLFKTIEDIKNVSGIGDKIFEEIKAYITI